MHVLCDITHPAHVHFFKNAIYNWREQGHRVTITTRGKDITLELLDNLGLEYLYLGDAAGGIKGLVLELPVRDLKLTALVWALKPDVLCAIGGIFIAHAGFLTRTPSVVFYDTEHANMQNALTYPLSSAVCTPQCYESWVPKKNHVPYAGYHELAYTHPARFTPDPKVPELFGTRKGQYILMRLVSWGATHDVGDSGITQIEDAVSRLEQYGQVLITSERPLPAALEKHRITARPELVHHLLAHAKLYIGESATMASEAACLGTPSVFVSTSVRGYTNEQEAKYGLTYTFSDPKTCQADGLEKALEILADKNSPKIWQQKREKMLADMIDVTSFIESQVEHWAGRKKKK